MRRNQRMRLQGWARSFLMVGIGLSIAATASSARGESAPTDHQAHHPASGTAGTPPASPPVLPPAGASGGMASMMESMMKGMTGCMGAGCMGVPPLREIYPEMMRLEGVSPADRTALISRAQERRAEGARRLAAGIERIDQALRAEDTVALAEALAETRAGFDELESGLATTKALERGDEPKKIALAWFRDQLTLSPANSATAGHPFGQGWLHIGAMTVLTLFAFSMIAMYFHKMRRAAALLADLGQRASTPPANAPASTASSTHKTGREVSVADPLSMRPPATPESSSAAAATEASRFEMLRKTGPCGSCKNPCSVRMRVARVYDETPKIKTFRLAALDGGPLPFDYLPGQFLNVVIPSGPDGATTKRSYTIASSPTQTAYCEITVKREDEGVVSRALHDTITTGSELRISAPYGRFCFTGEEAPSIVLIGAGVGITPLMSVIRYLTDLSWPGEIALIFGFRRPEDFLYREELDRLGHLHPNLKVVPVASRADGTDWTGRRGRITSELVREAVPEIADRLVHVCGPKPMLDATRAFLRDLGVPRERIRFESFGSAVPIPSVEAIVPASVAAIPTVTFARSQKAAPLPTGRTVLEAAEAAGVEIEWSCRAGTCGLCKVKLISGEVSMEVEDGLDEDDRAAGLILACQAKASADVTVEA